MVLRQMEPICKMVGGRKFYITPFPAMKAANLSGELASLLAPILGALVPLIADGKEKSSNDDGDGSFLDKDIDEKAGSLIGSLAISGYKLEVLMRKLLLGGHIVTEYENPDTGEIESERLDIDLINEIFCGEVQDMYVLCFHVIRLNFNGFFVKLANLSGKAKEKSEAFLRRVL